MPDRSFEGLAAHLHREGIAPSRARRMIDEWHTHWLELTNAAVARGVPIADAQAIADGRLGSDEVLLHGVLDQLQLRCWSRRWPWLCALVPGGLLLIAELLAFGALIVIVSFDRPDPSVRQGLWNLHGLFQAYRMLLLYGLPLVATALLGAYAARRGLQARWAVLGCLFTSALAATIRFVARLPLAGVHPGRIGASLDFSASLQGMRSFGARWLPLALLSLAFYLCCQWAASREKGNSEEPPAPGAFEARS